MQHTLKRTTHRQLRWDNIMVFVLFVVMFITLVFAIASWHKTPEIVRSIPYDVQYGDTLWSIAKMSNGYDHLDTRDIIYDIKELSNCTSDLQYGQIVQIPVYDEEGL